ncbi:unnamed protein product [Coffea canephora]|uniref:Uncharacterized protein n=1 Tax=Coffea canephora TaxID=49390 RepID=A0A068VH38_COFCA|nr:unnamed protein product [Coffea canephora]
MGTVYLILKTIVAVLSCVKSSALSSSQGNLVVRCNESEKSALVKFREDCSNSMDRFSSWITEEDCCNWRGVMCSNKTGQWHVTMLDLRCHGPAESSQGDQVSDSLLDLPYLSYLDLSSNNFLQGQVPEFIGSLKNLEYLNLSNANFRGMIPDHLGNLSQLQYLDLSGNEYALRANKLEWLHGLSSLKVLELGGVDLSLVVNWLDAVNMLPSLVKLGFFACELNTLPLRPSAMNFTQLQILDLSFNKFNSPMPYWVFNISQSLSYINLSSNNLGGKLPDFSSKLNLSVLDMSKNSFVDPLPHFSLSMMSLILAENMITGTISPICESLVVNNSLSYLDLSLNALSGSIPDCWTRGNNLVVLNLAYNDISGMIPNSTGHLVHLKALILGINVLSGELPASLKYLTNYMSWILDTIIYLAKYQNGLGKIWEI